MATTTTIGPLAAMTKFFGKKPGQGIREIGAECKTALAADRPEWIRMLTEQAGFNLTPEPFQSEVA